MGQRGKQSRRPLLKHCEVCRADELRCDVMEE
jgi:hypothetical protein